MLILPTPLIVSSGSLTRFLASSVISRNGSSPLTAMDMTGAAPGVELLDDGRVGALRELGQHAADRVADLLRAHVGVLLEHEGDDHLAQALEAGRSKLVDARDGVDRLLERLGDGGLDLLGARPAQRRRDRDDRQVDVGEKVHAQAAVGEHPQDHQGRDHHGREDRTGDADVGELHFFSPASSGRTSTGLPSFRP
jgi:hypothetical protein